MIKLTYITITAFALMMFSQCDAQKKQSSSESGNVKTDSSVQKAQSISVKLTEMTRGMRKSIELTPKLAVSDINGTKVQKEMTSADWQEIQNILKGISLDKIPKYTSPTTERFSDGALASKITISVDHKVYSSQEFDSGKPPAELAKLYSQLAGRFPAAKPKY